MDDPRFLRIITVGLMLAALAVVYFLLSGGFAVKNKKVQGQSTQIKRAVPIATTQPQQAATQSAYSRILERSQSNVQTLPNTGFPVGLAVVFSIGTIIFGWSLRKYYH